MVAFLPREVILGLPSLCTFDGSNKGEHHNQQTTTKEKQKHVTMLKFNYKPALRNLFLNRKEQNIKQKQEKHLHWGTTNLVYNYMEEVEIPM